MTLTREFKVNGDGTFTYGQITLRFDDKITPEDRALLVDAQNGTVPYQPLEQWLIAAEKELAGDGPSTLTITDFHTHNGNPWENTGRLPSHISARYLPDKPAIRGRDLELSGDTKALLIVLETDDGYSVVVSDVTRQALPNIYYGLLHGEATNIDRINRTCSLNFRNPAVGKVLCPEGTSVHYIGHRDYPSLLGYVSETNRVDLVKIEVTAKQLNAMNDALECIAEQDGRIHGIIEIGDLAGQLRLEQGIGGSDPVLLQPLQTFLTLAMAQKAGESLCQYAKTESAIRAANTLNTGLTLNGPGS